MNESKEVVKAEPVALVPVEQEFASLERVAKYAFESKLFKLASYEQAVTIALYARELGIGPVTAYRGGVYVVNGRPALSAQMMLGLALRRGILKDYEILFDKQTREVTFRGQRAGSERWHEFSFGEAHAKQAKLTGKENWQHYFREMCVARATAGWMRTYAPDAFAQCYIEDEVEDFDVKKQVAEAFDKPAEPEKAPAAATPTEFEEWAHKHGLNESARQALTGLVLVKRIKALSHLKNWLLKHGWRDCQELRWTRGDFVQIVEALGILDDILESEAIADDAGDNEAVSDEAPQGEGAAEPEPGERGA